MTGLRNEFAKLEKVQETASGNGSTVAFTMSSKIHSLDGIDVIQDGLFLTRGVHFTVTLPTTVTMTIAPALGQRIVFKYFKG